MIRSIYQRVSGAFRKMARVKKLSFVLLAAIAINLSTGQKASAAEGNRFAVFMLSNPTNVNPVTYYVKWGDGNWTRYTLGKGKRVAHYWTFSKVNQNRSPIPYIKFETGVFEKGTPARDRGTQTYRLEPYASPWNFMFGKPYRFSLVTNPGDDHLAVYQDD